MREDIVAGIRNAITRGESVEKAMQSFINAGYSEDEVREAGQSITGGISSMSYPEPSSSLGEVSEEHALPEMPSPNEVQQTNSQPQIQPNMQQTQGMQAQQPGVPQGGVPMESVLPVEEKKSGKKVWILVAILFLLIVFVGGLIYLIMNLS